MKQFGQGGLKILLICTFEPRQVHLNLAKYIWTSPSTFEPRQVHLNLAKYIWTSPKDGTRSFNPATSWSENKGRRTDDTKPHSCSVNFRFGPTFFIGLVDMN